MLALVVNKLFNIHMPEIENKLKYVISGVEPLIDTQERHKIVPCS